MDNMQNPDGATVKSSYRSFFDHLLLILLVNKNFEKQKGKANVNIMDIQPRRTKQLLLEWGITEIEIANERSPNRYPTIIIPITPSTEPRPIRTRELLDKQQQEELGKRPASASKICTYSKKILKTPVNTKTIKNERTPTPTSDILPYVELLPLRTKELLERQQQEEVNRRPDSASRIRSTSAKKGLNPLTPSLFKTPQTKRQLQFTPTPDRTTPVLTGKIKRLAMQFRQVQGLCTITEQKLVQLSIMDFVSILNQTLPFTGVVQRDFRLNKANYVEETVIALDRLNYPQRVNKSYLKMPGTRHGLSVIIDIVDFLLDFATVGNMLKVFELNDDETFNNVAKSYQKWPGNKNDLLPYLLYTDLKDQFDSIEKEFKHFQIGPELTQLLSDKERIEKELNCLQNELKELLNESSQHMKNMAQLCTDNWRLMKTIDTLQNVVVNQKHCHLSYRSKLNLYAELQDRLKLCGYQLHEFSERFRLLDLKRRRSCKELLEHIEAYNVLVRDIEYSSVMSISCSNMELALPTTLEEIKKRSLQLQQLREYFEFICSYYSKD